MTNYRDFNRKSADDWDAFLFYKYGFGLYPFCYVLAKFIHESDSRYLGRPNELPPVLAKGRAVQFKGTTNRIKRNENLIKRIFIVLTKNLNSWGIEKSGKIAEEYIKKIYPEIARFIEIIHEENDFDRLQLLKKSLWRKKGHPTDTRNKIAFVFAQVIKNANDEPDWDVIKSLLLWLWQRIKKADYHNELALEVPVFNKATLRTAHYKFIHNDQKRDNIVERFGDCFSPLRLKRAKRIQFNMKYIVTDTISDDIESRYPTVAFPDGEVLFGMLDLKRAASVLGLRTSVIKRMVDKDYIPFQIVGPKEKATFSRTELQLWLKDKRKQSQSRQ